MQSSYRSSFHLLFSVISVLFLAFAGSCAHAQLTIEISGSGAKHIPVTIADFEGESGLFSSVNPSVSAIARADLERSGLFKVTSASTLPENTPLAFDDWKSRGADAMVVGSILSQGGKRYEVRFRLYDVQRKISLGSLSYTIPANASRAAGHRVADFIYEKLVGEPGIFSTRIAYVVKVGQRYELQIADADGMNVQTALASREPIISLTWSPDGQRIAYVSFESKKPVVYVHILATGQRHVVANFKGSNSAPAWSPDGKRLALVLSRTGGSQMYLVNPDGTGLTRLATSSGIDTEPSFSPDGQMIYFTSDRGGTPQIYRISVAGGEAQRVSFEGSYNVTPRVSPKGKSLAFIARNEGRFQLTLMDLVTRQTQVLTDSTKDESPSFSPNGQLILYASEAGGKGVLAAVSPDGLIKQRLSVMRGDVREPTWGPFVK